MRSDVVITTALVPGRPAAKLVTAGGVQAMKPGSVIVDLAAEAGGNCELTELGETIATANAVQVDGIASRGARRSCARARSRLREWARWTY